MAGESGARSMNDDVIREHLARLLGWEDAHVGFDKVAHGIPPALRGKRPARMPYSAWQLVEHLRITQQDILDFCRNPQYQELHWPRDYWPASASPPSTRAWAASIKAFKADRDALRQLAADRQIDLTARIPHGSGQTFLREIVLAADHTAYHVGQLVLLRRLLGIWTS
jgi:hypothetical protein